MCHRRNHYFHPENPHSHVSYSQGAESSAREKGPIILWYTEYRIQEKKKRSFHFSFDEGKKKFFIYSFFTTWILETVEKL